MVQIGDKIIDYNEEFRLFLSTRNPNPFIPPDAASIVTEVNFTTTRSGLRGQVRVAPRRDLCGLRQLGAAWCFRGLPALEVPLWK